MQQWTSMVHLKRQYSEFPLYESKQTNKQLFLSLGGYWMMHLPGTHDA